MATSGARVTSPASNDAVARPQAYRSSGNAAASASPAAMPDRGLHHRRRHGRDTRDVGDGKRRTYSTDRLHLEDHGVGGARRAEPTRVVERTDALVRGDRNRDPSAHAGHVVEAGHRLLDVFEVVTRQSPDDRHRGVHVP